MGWLPDSWLTKCPFCGVEGTGETIEHMLVSCTAWSDLRIGMNQDFIALLGGGRDAEGAGMGRMEAMDWTGDYQDTPFCPDLLPQTGNDPQMEDTRLPGFMTTVSFLTKMMPIRQRRLQHLLRNAPRADAVNGRADFADEMDLQGYQDDLL